MSARQRRYAGDVAGGEAKAGTVQARGVAPPAGGVADDTDAYFHHQLGFHRVTASVSRPQNGRPVHG